MEDAVKTAESCRSFAAMVSAEAEKIAAADASVVDLQTTLVKAAHYLEEMVKVAEARGKYAASILDQFESAARVDEALKVASELIRDGMVPVPDDLEGYVRKLATQNLEVVKAAAEMAATSGFGELGAPEKFSKVASSGGADWEQEHAFLFTR